MPPTPRSGYGELPASRGIRRPRPGRDGYCRDLLCKRVEPASRGWDGGTGADAPATVDEYADWLTGAR